VDFEFQAQTGLNEVISAGSSRFGAVAIAGVQVTGTGSTVAPVVSTNVATNSNTLTWTDTGTGNYTYVYDKASGALTISGGTLGTAGEGGNTITIEKFNLPAAENGGFLGIILGKSAFVNFGATTGIDPAAPDFIAGSTQSYTFSTDSPSDTAQTVTLTLSGVDPSDFDVTVTGQTVLQNSDGSFSFTLPAGETNIAYSLTNTADRNFKRPVRSKSAPTCYL
jgi:hypothetical protein